MTNAVDSVKSVYAGFASGDIGAVLEALDPAIEWTEAEGFPYGGTFKATGKHFRAPFVHVWRSRGGALVKFRQHTDTAFVQAALR